MIKVEGEEYDLLMSFDPCSIFGLRFFWLIRLFYFVVVSGKGCLYLGIPFPFYCNEIRL